MASTVGVYVKFVHKGVGDNVGGGTEGEIYGIYISSLV